MAGKIRRRAAKEDLVETVDPVYIHMPNVDIGILFIKR